MCDSFETFKKANNWKGRKRERERAEKIETKNTIALNTIHIF